MNQITTGCGTTIKAAKALAADNMIKVIESKRSEIEAKLLKEAPLKPTPTVNKDPAPNSEKDKIFEIDPQSQMNPLALVNQLFNPEIIIEEVVRF